MASVRRVLENRAENASAYGKVNTHNEAHEKHMVATGQYQSHGAPLASSTRNVSQCENCY